MARANGRDTAVELVLKLSCNGVPRSDQRPMFLPLLSHLDLMCPSVQVNAVASPKRLKLTDVKSRKSKPTSRRTSEGWEIERRVEVSLLCLPLAPKVSASEPLVNDSFSR